MPSSPEGPLVRAVFGLLVIATTAAFFITQRLKRETPVVERVFFPRYVSPNGDGRKDVVGLRFDLPEPDDVTASVVDERGDEVRRLADDRALGRGTHRFVWDGRTTEGRLAEDGDYRLRVTLRSEGRSVTAPRTLLLDTTPPAPELVAVSPPTIVPGDRGRRGRARIRYRGPQDPAPVFRVYRTDRGAPVEVARFRGPRFRETAVWDARVDGSPAPEGIYAFSVTVRDKAGNAGSAPRVLPPARGSAAEGTGTSVRYLRAAGPLETVRAGRIARLRVGPKPRRFRWNLARLGAGRPLRRGRGSRRTLAFRIPRAARTGLYLVRIQAAGRRAVVPLAVRGRGGGARRPLVVLPAIAWQGRNPVDEDRDGFADTLDSGGPVLAERPFARGRLPPALAGEAGPLLRFLDRQRPPYDLTTDLALARGRGPGVRGRPGVAFAGSERWLTEALDLRLRGYVEAGGRVASFGTDAFRRRVALDGGRLAEPSAPEVANVFGEKTSRVEIAAAPMVVFADRRLSLFAGTDGFIGLFSEFEQSGGLVPGARLLATAGRDAKRPAFVAYRLGRGLVVRVGAPGWSRALAGGAEVARVTRRIWTLLSR